MQQGQILGIIGGTGSGKSSLVQVLLGLYQPDSGSIALSQAGTSPQNLAQWRSWIAYVPQKVELFKESIRSNLTLGMEDPVSDQELWQALEIAQAKDFVSDRKVSWMQRFKQVVVISQVGKSNVYRLPGQSCVVHHSSSWMMRLRLLIPLLSPIF